MLSWRDLWQVCLSLMKELTDKHFPVYKPGLKIVIAAFPPTKLKRLKTLIRIL